MFDTVAKYTLLSIAALAIASCASGPFNGPEHAMTVAETHPISVDSQVVTLTIDVDPTVTDLTATDKARLHAFADAYMRDGHGPLTLTAPSGTAEDFEGHEAAADIRAELNDAGVPWSALAGATYRTGGKADGDQLILSYTHYVATASKCGIWTGSRGRDYRNLRTPNFGCATQNNIAAMLADPHDLVGPVEFASGDAEATVRAYEAFRKGDVTAADVDDTISAEASGN